MGSRSYPAEFRRRVLELHAADHKVVALARDLGVSEQTIYAWRCQERIDQGLVPGLTSVERQELLAAKRRIRELEAELAVHGRASELLAEHNDPKQVRGDPRGARRVLPACRRLVDRCVADRCLVTNALGMAIDQRGPDGTVIHSDQGTPSSRRGRSSDVPGLGAPAVDGGGGQLLR